MFACQDDGDIRTRRKLPLDIKVLLTEKRIKAWYSHWGGNVYISFSGGKDSTVLLNLVRKYYPDVPAVFVDTGLEFPEIKEFIRNTPNVIWLKPKMTFKEVIEKYGFPMVSKDVAQKIEEIRNTKSDKLRNKRLYGDDKGNGKIPEKWKYLINKDIKISHKCCAVMKKSPIISYEKKTGCKPFIGMLSDESTLRASKNKQCNEFDSIRPKSNPMLFWNTEDVLQYAKRENIALAKVYSMGYTRTGCVFCMFGAHLEKPTNRFHRLKETHPKLYDYCMDKLGLRKALKMLDIDMAQYDRLVENLF
jgi:3'-phosphoadenosine 5'-phosphosulfate sulfotransferase (PAPS reductase)/FAD synthetase